jgi:hypothetical protein
MKENENNKKKRKNSYGLKKICLIQSLGLGIPFSRKNKTNKRSIYPNIQTLVWKVIIKTFEAAGIEKTLIGSKNKITKKQSNSIIIRSC